MNLQLRATVARSTRTLAPMWPLSSFIAINPLGALESERFERVAPARPREDFLADYRSGRILDEDLLAALREQVPEIGAADETFGVVCVGGTNWSATSLIARELIQPAPSWSDTSAVDSRRNRGGQDLVGQLTAKWMAAYLDQHPLWPMPEKERGLWAAWTTLAPYDFHLPRRARRRLAQLPSSPDAALEAALEELQISAAQREDALRREIESLPGWAAHVKWRSEHTGDVDLTSYLAMRMSIRAALRSKPRPAFVASSPASSVWDRAATMCAAVADSPVAPATVALVARILALHPVDLHAATWQTAYEHHYRSRMIDSIAHPEKPTTNPHPESRMQVIFCIDPRSEGMRRHLEADPSIETFGAAGFFGVPIRFTRYQGRGAIDALPALLTPRHSVTETTTDTRRARRRARMLRLRDAVEAAWHIADTSPAAPFALAEVIGWFLGLGSALRTVLPSGVRTIRRGAALTSPELSTTLTIADAFTLDERVALAESGMRMMGLEGCAPLVVLTGHRSSSTNNLYQSALDCGACGGNPGGANARAAAAIFNDPDVRAVLAGRGLPIPDTTFFVAAEHDTVTDRIRVLDGHLMPESHAAIVNRFTKGQEAAGARLLTERAAALPGARSHGRRRLRARADDWAEVYPELGLAGNAALIIGPREISRGVDLQRRTFLHSYQPHLDPTGAALEQIMTAPLVVAQWINHQYYFSTVESEKWGAGTKTIHNAIGTYGVISGQAGDLRLGLPLQSIAFGGRSLHEPMRLTVLIQAPLRQIGEIVSRNQTLRNLFDNDWITLTARDDAHSTWRRYTLHGWKPVTPTTDN